MEAIRMVSICYVGDNNQTGTIIDETRQNPAMVFYLKPEADAEIARLEHQIEVLNADLTRCQEAKTAIGDKCLRLVDSLKEIADSFGSTGEDAINFREWAKQALSGGR